MHIMVTSSRDRRPAAYRRGWLGTLVHQHREHQPCAKTLCTGSPPTPRRGVHFAPEAAAPKASTAEAHGLLSRALRPTMLAARQRSLHNLLDLGVASSADVAVGAVRYQLHAPLPVLSIMTLLTIRDTGRRSPQLYP